MGMARYRQRLGVGVAAVILALATGAAGAAAEDKGPNTGRVSLSMGVDWTTHYFFRGILQEDQNYIIQPYGDVTFKLLEGKGALTNLGFTLGLWNSLHGGPSGVEGNASVDPKMWYEADFYAKLGATFAENLSTAIIYTAYMSPNDRFATVEEIALSLAYNDSKLLGPFALNPSVLIAFETDGQADAGRSEGISLQLGISPGYTFNAVGTYPISVTLPLVLGLSLGDYYERIGVGGSDDTFGYFSASLAASVPLKFAPAAYGAWQVKGALTVLTLGDQLKAPKKRAGTEVIGTIGIALTY
jgi:hypothetical protein